MFTSAQTERAQPFTKCRRGADPGLTEREPWCIGSLGRPRAAKGRKMPATGSAAWRLKHAETAMFVQQGVKHEL